MAGLLAVCAGTLLSCTAPNPAYRPEQPRGADARDEQPDASHASSGETGDAAGPDTTGDAWGPDVPAPTAAGCGSARPPLTDLVGVDSMAIDARGSIYFNNDDGTLGWIGKLPPHGPADKHWLSLPLGPPTRGMAVDDVLGVIYFTAGVPGSGAVELQAADLTGAPIARTLYKGLIDANDVAVDLNGNVYVSDQGDGHIYSFTPSGQRTKVTQTPVGMASNGTHPAGLAFAPDHTLVVGYKGHGKLVRLSIGANHVETHRGNFGPINDWVNGLAYDQRGRLYLALYDLVAPRDVVRLDADDAAPVTIVSGGHFSAMAFGRGELDCTDLYIADPDAGMVVRRVTTSYAGLSIR
jgi:streptogramin lyase